MADAGGLVAYTVMVSNLGKQDATGISVIDTLPGSMSFEPAGSEPAWSCSGSSCTLAVGDLAAGDVVSFDLVVRVDAALPAGLEELVNTAVVAADEDLDGSNNTAEEITPLAAGVGADLTIAKDDVRLDELQLDVLEEELPFRETTRTWRESLPTRQPRTS